MEVSQSGTKYVGGGHWATIADTLPGGKSSILEHSSWPAPSRQSRMPDLLHGSHSGAAYTDILASIPTRAETDTLLTMYFESLDGSILLTHEATFRKQYVDFWPNPGAVSKNWLSMLFSILCLASDYAAGRGEHPSKSLLKAEDVVFLYRQRSAECLILAEYTRPTALTVEALALYFSTELIRMPSNQFDVHIVLGILVRTAMRMGYHRDPSRYPNISVFDGELRRRVWVVIVQVDLLLAFQLGLPCLINHADYDTKIPRNLNEAELHDGISSLPPPRTPNFPDKLTYIVARAQFSAVLGQINSLVSSIHPLSDDSVFELHVRLGTHYDGIPSCLKLLGRLSVASCDDDILVAMRRVNVDLLYQRGRYLLHRRFMTTATGQRGRQLSWDTCIDAAISIIGHQSFWRDVLHISGWPCGQRWKIMNLGAHDFIVANMILCHALKAASGAVAMTNRSHGYSHEDKLHKEIRLALEESRNIWTGWQADLREAEEVVSILSSVLDTDQAEYVSTDLQRPETGATPISQATTMQDMPQTLNTTNSASMQSASYNDAFELPLSQMWPNSNADVMGLDIDWESILSNIPYMEVLY